MKRKTRNIILFVLVVFILLCIMVARTTITNLLKGNVHFPKELIGEVLTMEDGQKFTVFRRLIVANTGINSEHPAIFKVRFKFRNLSIDTNKRLSIIPAPFFMGMKGFMEKDWSVNEDTNDFQGIYQWSSKEIAERYPNTFIFKLMTMRAVPGTVSYEIIPDADLSDYLKGICSQDP